MQKNYNNRAMKTEPPKKEAFFYPSLGKVIYAKDKKEADEKAKKLLSKK